MDKIYCRNLYAEVTQNLKSCPVCGIVFLKPTAMVPKPTYTYHFTPTKQLEGIKKLKNGALVLGLVLIGVGLVLYLAYQISITVIGLGISTVVIGIILFKTSEIPNINWRSYFIDLNSEGGKFYLIGAVSSLFRSWVGAYPSCHTKCWPYWFVYFGRAV